MTVVVDALTAGDEAAFVAGVRASRHLHRPWLDPPDDADRFAAHLAGSGPDSHVPFALRCGACGALAGWVTVANIVRRAFRSATLGYGAFASHAGRGLMAEGLRGVLAEVFGPLALHRVEANIQPGNARSIALVRRLGFELEGRSPAFLEVGGAWRDHERWALRAESFHALSSLPAWSPERPLRTDRLVLRPFERGDAGALVDLYGRSEVVRYLCIEQLGADRVDEAITRKVGQRVLRRGGDRLSLAVTLADTATVIGDVSLRWASVEDRQGELGCVLHPDHRGRGYATEAAGALLHEGFEGLDLHRTFASCDARDEASAAVLRRLGMRQEAHLVHHQRCKGAWGEELVFAVLASEHRAGRGAGAGA